MTEEAPRRTWAGILQRAANTDPPDKIVRIKREIEDLANTRRRMRNEREDIDKERIRLRAAYAVEMERMDDEQREADERLRMIEDQLRSALAALDIGPELFDGGTNDPPV